MDVSHNTIVIDPFLIGRRGEVQHHYATWIARVVVAERLEESTAVSFINIVHRVVRNNIFIHPGINVLLPIVFEV